MKRKWARCAVCGKATWFCARHGCKPTGPQKKEPLVFVGLADVSFSSSGANIVVMADSAETAQAEMLRLYNRERAAYGSETFATFEELHDWNGASVKPLQMNRAVIWEQI